MYVSGYFKQFNIIKFTYDNVSVSSSSRIYLNTDF